MEVRNQTVTERLGRNALFGSLVGNILTVFVGTGDQSAGNPTATVIAGQNVGKNSGIARSHMRRGVHVVDRSCDVVLGTHRNPRSIAKTKVLASCSVKTVHSSAGPYLQIWK